MNSQMHSSLRAAILTLGMIAIPMMPAKADIQDIRSANNEIWASAGGAFFNYKEPAVAPDLPDSEHGELPSLATGVSMMIPDSSRGFSRNLYLSLEGSGTFGDAHYNGAYLNFPTTPARARPPRRSGPWTARSAGACPSTA